MLDAELEKIESFYAEREKEMSELAKQLREQLNELGVHRQIFYVGALHLGQSTHDTKVRPISNHRRPQRPKIGLRKRIFPFRLRFCH